MLGNAENTAAGAAAAAAAVAVAAAGDAGLPPSPGDCDARCRVRCAQYWLHECLADSMGALTLALPGARWT